MKRLVLFTVVCSIMYVTPVQAYLVNTTFEGWTVGSNWPGNIDPASGQTWAGLPAPAIPARATVIGTGAVEGSNAGKILPDAQFEGAELLFGTGTNTGSYEVTWYERFDHVASTASYNNSTVYIRNTATATATEIRMVYYAASPTKIDVKTTGGAYTPVLTPFVDDAWYQFRLILNVPTQKFDIRVTQVDTGTWSELLNVNFAAAMTSFDKIKITHKDTSASDVSYWDDIKVAQIPEPATLFILAAGSSMLLRRRCRS